MMPGFNFQLLKGANACMGTINALAIQSIRDVLDRTDHHSTILAFLPGAAG